MLDADQLASMRACVEEAMPDTAVILTAPRVTGQAGGWKDDWDHAAESEPLACFLMDAAAPGERIEGGKAVSELRYIVRLPYGTPVTSRQRLRVNGTTFQVLTVPPAKAWDTSLDCTCRTL